jgi:hypothetical protein
MHRAERLEFSGLGKGRTSRQRHQYDGRSQAKSHRASYQRLAGKPGCAADPHTLRAKGFVDFIFSKL